MPNYLSELHRLAERERRVLEAMSNNGTAACIVKIQRGRYEKLQQELERLGDYYSLNADMGAH